MAPGDGVQFVAHPEQLRTTTASEVRRVAGRVTEVGTRVGEIRVSAFASGNVTATAAISTFVASAAHDASAIASALGADADHVRAAATTYTGTDDASAGSYDGLSSAWGVGP